MLVFDNHIKAYVPLASEGGHGDFPVHDEEEQKLVNFIIKNKSDKGKKAAVSYEDVLSGRGIENIYAYLRSSKKFKQAKYDKEIAKAKDKAALISKYRKTDATCKAVFDLFTKFYARCARNYALDVLALGGVYLAGGMAAKNSDMFKKKAFRNEFEQNGRHRALLRQIPIFVLVNGNVSLYGASLAAMMRQDLAVRK